jgi:hypothetical protein
VQLLIKLSVKRIWVVLQDYISNLSRKDSIII